MLIAPGLFFSMQSRVVAVWAEIPMIPDGSWFIVSLWMLFQDSYAWPCWLKLNALRVSDILYWLQWLIMDAAHYITPLPLIMGLWRGLKKAFHQSVQSREGAMWVLASLEHHSPPVYPSNGGLYHHSWKTPQSVIEEGPPHRDKPL